MEKDCPQAIQAVANPKPLSFDWKSQLRGFLGVTKRLTLKQMVIDVINESSEGIMSYQIIKKLKDCGYPQDSIMSTINMVGRDGYVRRIKREGSSGYIYFPNDLEPSAVPVEYVLVDRAKLSAMRKDLLRMTRQLAEMMNKK